MAGDYLQAEKQFNLLPVLAVYPPQLNVNKNGQHRPHTALHTRQLSINEKNSANSLIVLVFQTLLLL